MNWYLENILHWVLPKAGKTYYQVRDGSVDWVAVNEVPRGRWAWERKKFSEIVRDLRTVVAYDYRP